MIILGRESEDNFCTRLANELGKFNDDESIDFFPLEHIHHPDNESKPRITDGPDELGKYKDPDGIVQRARAREKVVLVSRGKSGEDWNPADIFIDAIFTAGALRDNVPDAKICVVLPYYVYSRQHDQFRAGEPISAKYVGQILKDRERFGDMVISVSAHQKRTEGEIDNRIWNMDATPSVIDFVQRLELLDKRYIVTPDSGQYSGKLRFPLAESLNAGTIAFGKERDRTKGEVNVDTRHLGALENKDEISLLLYDDELNTGDTVYKDIIRCVDDGIQPENIHVVVVHAKDSIHSDYNKRAIDLIQETGANIYASDTIESPISEYSIVPQLAKCIKKRFW